MSKVPANVSPLLTDPVDRYDMVRKIGEGGYGNVFHAFDNVTHTAVAVKIIELEDNEADSVHREISVMSEAHCAQLVRYLDSYIVGQQLWIVMEYLECGSLLDLIKEHGPLPESCIAYILHELLLALSYLHSHLKIHRDVKA
eukprot:gene49267-60311_t